MTENVDHTPTEDLWYVVAEHHEPHLVAHYAHTTGVEFNPETNRREEVIEWRSVDGPVFTITEHKYRTDAAGFIHGLVDSRTRLVMRAHDNDLGNGHPFAFEPFAVENPAEHDDVLGYGRLRFVTQPPESPAGVTESSAERARGRHVQQQLLGIFTDERFMRTKWDTTYVRLPVAYDAYLAWCGERSIAVHHIVEYNVFTVSLPGLGYPVSANPREVEPHVYEYVIERCTLAE